MYKLEGTWFADDLAVMGHYLVSLGEAMKAAHDQEEPEMVMGHDRDRVAPGKTALGADHGGIQWSTELTEVGDP